MTGFSNRKHGPPHIVRVEREASQHSHWEDFKLRTDPDERREHAVPTQVPKGQPREEVTQSERDWAFAKRALARGDDPEEVIRRISDYRGEEKHSNYARYTVEKAQVALQARPGAGSAPERTRDSRYESIDIPAERQGSR